MPVLCITDGEYSYYHVLCHLQVPDGFTIEAEWAAFAERYVTGEGIYRRMDDEALARDGYADFPGWLIKEKGCAVVECGVVNLLDLDVEHRWHALPPPTPHVPTALALPPLAVLEEIRSCDSWDDAQAWYGEMFPASLQMPWSQMLPALQQRIDLPGTVSGAVLLEAHRAAVYAVNPHLAAMAALENGNV